jgi:glycyl-tRNA synthetase beta chain
VLASELRVPLREAVAAWYRALRCYVDPGRALWVSTPKLVAHLGAAGRAKSREFEAYLREFDEALLDGKPQVVAMAREVDLVFDRLEREKPAGEVLFEFRPYDEVAADIVAFFADRLEVWLRERGQRHDLLAAVFALGDDDLVRVVARVNALDAFLKTEDGANLLAGYKRAVNILKAEEKKGPLPVGAPVRMPASPPEELALIAAVGDLDARLDAALDAEDFAGAMRALSALRGPVDAFFDKVLVNSEVAEERENRLRLLAKVKGAMGQVADFSQVTG